MNKHNQPIDPAIIAEAAEWLVEMQEGELSAEKQKQFEAWKSQGTEYINAWQHAEQLQQYLNDVPSHVNDKLFDDKQFKLLSQKFIWILILTGGLFITGYYGKQNAWFADQRTAYGEQRTVILEDGSQIILNSKTAIDINFSKTARNIKLHYGEIYIQTAKDQSKQPRPFKVLSQDGSVLALGTQFNVEQLQNQTQVAVIEHAVLIENKSGIKQHLNAGEQTEFSTQYIGQPYAINTLDLAWHNHLIVADRMPLHEFIKQIEKHYGMSIEIDQRIKNLVISGTYPSNNLKVLTSTLAQAYQLEIETKTFPKKLTINKNDN